MSRRTRVPRGAEVWQLEASPGASPHVALMQISSQLEMGKEGKNVPSSLSDAIDAPFFSEGLVKHAVHCAAASPSLACRPGSLRASFLPSRLGVCDFAKRTKVEIGRAAEAEVNRVGAGVIAHTHAHAGWSEDGRVGCLFFLIFHYVLHLCFYFTVKLL